MYQRLSLTVLALLVLFSSAAHAQLDGAMASMFRTAGTAAGAYESQSRFGFVGGSATLRSPTRNLNLYNLQAPQLRGGCGGIDMYFGSFSFINGEQFKQLIRSIGANSVGYAFQVAIHSMCNVCGGILNSMQKVVNGLNKMQRNSCQIARGMINDVANASGMLQRKLEGDSLKEIIKGTYDDMAQVWDELQSDVRSMSLETPNATTSDKPLAGNLMWRAMIRSGASDLVGDTATAASNFGRQELIEVAMSLVGTDIYPVKEGDCPNPNPDTNVCPPQHKPAVLSFGEFASGQFSTATQIYRCIGSDTTSELGCTKIEPQATTNANAFPGFRGYVNLQLMGTTETTRTPVAGSIVQRVIDGQALTAEQQAFVSAVDALPIYSAMLRVQKMPGAVSSLAEVTAPWIAETYAVVLGEAIVNAAKKAYAVTAGEIDRHAGFEEKVADVEAAIDRHRHTAKDVLAVVNAISEVVDNVNSWSPAVYGGTH